MARWRVFAALVALAAIWGVTDAGSTKTVNGTYTCVDYSVFNSTMLARVFRGGVLVVRGKDWQWGTQGSGGIGNITQGLGVYSSVGWIQVLWADGHRNSYRVGNSGKYDVCRLVDVNRNVPSPSVDTCNSIATFQASTDGYTQDTTDNFDWTRRRGSTPSVSTGPSSDHTFGNASGFYMYTEVSSVSQGTRARLISPSFSTQKSTCTLRFWYHMYGGAIGTLNVYIRIFGNDTLYWSKTGNQGNQWLSSGTLKFGAIPSFNLVFEGVSGTSFTGDIAIDDIQFGSCACAKVDGGWSSYGPYGPCSTTCGTGTYTRSRTCTNPAPVAGGAPCSGSPSQTSTCSSGLSCVEGMCNATALTTNFETGFQGWSQVTTDTRDFSRISGSTGSSGTGPSTDNTLGTSAGHYVYLETSFPSTAGDTAELLSPLYSGIPACTVEFHYHMLGATIGRLQLFLVIGTTSTQIWTLSGNQGSSWKSATVSLGTYTKTQQFQLKFRATAGSSFTGDIAIDDIRFQLNCCASSAITACTAPGASFETGWSGYVNDRGTKLETSDWIRKRAGTAVAGTPSVDHTTGLSSGYFVYAKSLGALTPSGQFARFISPAYIYSGTSSCSFTFRYNARNSPSLTVSIRTSSGLTKVPVTIRSTTGNGWSITPALSVPSAASQKPFQIVFDLAHTGAAPSLPIISMDDVVFSSSCCTQTVTQACKAPIADFTTGMSGYTQVTGSDDFNWVRQRGGTSSFATGPSTDHTTGTGYYLYIETSSPRRVGQKAIILSPFYTLTGTTVCSVGFWYHMYGTTVGSLTLQLKTATGTSTVIYSLSGNKGNTWFYHRLPLQGYPLVNSGASFQLQFTATVGSSFTGDIAIDDIGFYDDCCSGGAISPCTPTRYLASFTSSLDGFYNGRKDDFDWSQPAKVLSGSAPTTDATGKSGVQLAVAYISGTTKRGTSAYLYSPLFITPTTPAGTCSVQFSYWKSMSSTVSSLSVQLLSLGKNITLWTAPATGTLSWRKATVSISSSLVVGQYIQIVFVATRGSASSDSYIAVDEVATAAGCCSSALATCNAKTATFDTSLDGYTQSVNDKFDWTRQKSGTSSFNTGPSADQSGSGFYMYIETSSPRVAGDAAILYSPFYQAPVPTCEVSFWYHMYGTTVGQLNVSALVTGRPTIPLFSLQGNQGNSWKSTTIKLGNIKNVFRLEFIATRGTSFTGDIAIDTITFGASCCAVAAASCYVETATFDIGMSQYQQVTTDKTDWTRQRGATGSSATGPSQDVTPNAPFGNGYYMYLETSSGSTGDNAQLVSPKFNTPTTPLSCHVNFYYHMYGASLGALTVTVISGSTRTQKFRQSGGSQNLWKSNNFYVGSTASFQLLFEATRGTSFQGDIAIDQISVRHCCDESPCVIPPTDFEVGGQQGFYSGSGNFSWTYHSGGTGSTGTGPSSDATFGNSSGHYMYIETSFPRVPGDYAELLSSTYLPPRRANGKMTFAYHMSGATIGNLSVFGLPTGSSRRTLLWSLAGNQGTAWKTASVVISFKTSYQLIFRGTVGSSFTGDISIDDIKVDGSYCIDWSTYTSSQITSFFALGTRVVRGKDWSWGYQDGGPGAFGNVTTVLSSAGWVRVRWTNGHLNSYRMGSGGKYDLYRVPEIQTTPPVTTTPPTRTVCSLGLTNFESSLLNSWTQSKTDDTDWTLDSGGTPSFNTGPSVDHTLGTAAGHYLYLETSSISTGDTAVLVSPIFSAVYSVCNMKFWYHMYGTAIGTLKVSVVSTPGGVSKTIFIKTGNQGNKWIQGTGSLLPSTGAFTVQISASDGTSFTGDIAIDDISFDSGCCKDCHPSVNFGTTAGNYMGFWDEGYDDTNWRLLKGSTGSFATGPTVDHTSGTGYYAYLETSSPSTNGDHAFLSSPSYLAPTGPACTVTFWYHMYGTTIRTLNVHLKTYYSQSIVWTKTGNQGNSWVRATIKIPQFTAWVHQLRFEAVAGTSFTGDIAIDDISFSSDCGCLSCSTQINFETTNALTTLTQSKTDKFDWTIQSGPTGSTGTGPSIDHTLGTSAGKYIYMEVSGRSVGDTAIISLPPNIAPPGPQCQLVFWYHMLGSSIGTLAVGTGSGSSLWSKTGAQGSKWLQAIVPITTKSAFTVTFTGTVGTSFTGDIALDDIWLTPDCCTARPDLSKFSRSQLQVAFKQGTRVIRGRDWTYGTQDGNLPGTVTGNFTTTNFLQVTWDNGKVYSYRLGSGKYDLYLQIPPFKGPQTTVTPPTTTPGPTTSTAPPRAGCRDWTLYTNAQLGVLFKLATRVTAYGPGWSWGTQNGGTNGTVVSALTPTGYIGVTWDNGVTNTYRMGATGLYDLCLEVGIIGKPNAACTAPVLDFENTLKPMGNWSQVTGGGDTFDWTVDNGGTSSSSTGPGIDHTYGNASGHYLYIETSFPRGSGDTATIVSPVFTTNVVGCTLVFWYHMYGSTVNALHVNVTDIANQRQIPIWSMYKDQGDKWTRAEVNLANITGSFRVSFTGVVGTSFTGDIAIDDISFGKSCCGYPTCGAARADFQTGMDGFTQGTSDNFDWTRDFGGTTSFSTGPSVDHTVGTSSGYYMYIETSSPRTSGDKAQLFSRLYAEPATACTFSFWYHMYGATIGSLNVYVVRGGTNKQVWTKTGNQGNNWISSGNIAIGTGGQFQVMFEGVTGSSFTGDIAIDDFEFGTNCCPLSTCTASTSPTTWDGSSGSSSFQGYIQDASDNFDWTLDNGGTSSFSTGPGQDHTYKNRTGYYAYIESSFPRRVADVARLISPVYSSNAQYCSMTFWYHMYGTTVGTLNVYIRTPFKTTRLWTLSGNQGNQWLTSTVKIGVTAPDQFQLMFEGIIGTSFTGDIAVDDISFTSSCCAGVQPSACGAPTTNFETGLDGYTQPASDKFDWSRITGGSSSFGTGASGDHTSGSGYYMYIETSFPRARGDNALLVSPMYNNTLQLCSFNFWYHMYGSSIGALNVYINRTGVPRQLVWSKSGDRGNQWHLGRAPVGRFLGTFQIIFEGVVGTSFTGDIGLDDISFNTDCCFVVCPDTYTPYNSFQMSYIFGLGVRVQRGPDWLARYGQADGGIGQLGTVIRKAGSQSVGFATVLWDSGVSGIYRTGSGNNFDVCRYRALPDYAQFSIATLGTMFSSGTKVIRGKDWKWGNQDSLSEGMVTLSTNTSNSPGWVHATFVTHQNSYRVGAENAYDLWRVYDLIPRNYTPPTVATAPPTAQPIGNTSAIPCGINNNFENGLSGFIQDKRDTFDWSVGAGSTPSSSTGPQVDHTFDNSTGKYLFIEASFPRVNGDYARLYSPAYQPAETLACGFSIWYHMYGSGTGNFTIQLATSTALRTIFSQTGGQANAWQQAQIPLPTVSFEPWFQLVFIASVGSSFASDIAIDDFRFYSECCSSCNGPQTFESGLSGWTQSKADDFDWTLDVAGTGSFGTGPSVDHTFGTRLGQYLYIETSFPRTVGDRAIITSPVFRRPSSDLCSMTFWYHMHGTTIGTLNVSIITSAGSSVVWSLSGPQGNRWLSASVKLPAINYVLPFQVSFLGVAGTSFTGDIAIDDISFSDQCCPGCNGPVTFDSGKLPKGYTSASTSPLSWKLSKNLKTPGPSADHSTGSSYFAYIDLSPAHGSSVVTLSSPVNSAPTSASCAVTLFYFLNGLAARSLKITIAQADNTAIVSRTITSTVASSVWQTVTMPIPQTAGHFKLVIAGSVATGSFGAMAVDDIIFSKGCCANAIQTPTYTLYTATQMVALFPIGTRVVRGADFVYSHPGSSGVGNVTSAWSAGYVKVAWGSSSTSYTYAMGAGGLYELYRLSDLLTGAVTFKPTVPQPTAPVTPDYGVLSIAQLNIMFNVGTRVLRGRSWQYGSQDGGVTGRGTVQAFALPAATGSPALVQVKWDNGNVFSYRMGGGFYDLARVQDIGVSAVTGPYITTPPPTPSAPINYYLFTIAQLQKLFPVGTLVTRGKDWSWGDADVQIGMVGNVSIALDGQGYVQVTWANGFVGFYRMGYQNKYDLYRLVDLTNPPTPPVTTQPPPGIQTCRPITTFESGLMGYTNDATNAIDWGLLSGSTGSFGTGPSADHTLGNAAGQYVYFETSFPAQTGDVGRLISPIYPSPPGAICQGSFWYHMLGATIGSLNVTLKLSNGTNIMVWRKAGNQGNAWYQATFPIPNLGTSFQLVFAATAGTSFTGDIAIDDVGFGVGCCPHSVDYSVYAQAQLASLFPIGTQVVRGKDWQWGSQDNYGYGSVVANLTTGGYLRVRWLNSTTSYNYRMGALGKYDLYRVTDLTHKLPAVAPTAAPSCITYTFEDGTDGFVQTSGDDFDWTRVRGSTSSFQTGPSRDHTTDSFLGHFMYIETSFPRVAGDKAVMLSPAFNPPPRSGCTATVWVHLYGADVDRLEIWAFTVSGNRSLVTIAGDHGDKWIRQAISLNGISTTYRMAFVGYVGPSFQGDIAIDDLSFEVGCCPVYPDYSSYSPLRISTAFTVGTRVIRGKDWSWANADGGVGGVGTVTSALSVNGYIQVKWDVGTVGSYRMGASQKYDLYLAPIVSCNPLTAPTYGSITGGYNIHDTVTVSCNTGYTLAGPAQRTCTAQGSWTAGGSVCVKSSADYAKYTAAELAAIFVNGARVVRGPNWIYGTQDKSGPGTIVQGLGVYSKANYVQVAWDYAPSTFYEYRAGNGFFDVQLYAASSCPVLKAPTDGAITSNTGKFGQTVTITCKANFAVQGSRQRTCQAPGIWTGLPAICVAACKTTQFQCDDGTCISAAGHCDGLHTDCADASDEKYCTATLPPTVASNCSASQFQCYDFTCIPKAQRCDGNWWDCADGADERGCTNTTAQVLPDYSTYNKTYLRTVFRIGARVVRGKDWSYGSQDDFGVGTIISNFTASLLVRVRWDSGRIFPYRMGYSSKYDLYLVQGTNCPALPSILFGFVTTTGLKQSDVASYGCKSGYVLQGSPTRTCAGGYWTGSQPDCLIPTNSSHYQDYSKLSSVIIAQLFKVGTRVIPGRDWIWGNANRGQPGTVIAPLDDLGYVRVRWDGGNTGFYRMGNANSYDLALANITGCLPLPSPTNGYQQGTSTNTGSVTTFGCFPPYALQGPTVRTCQANGLWDGVESFCAKVAQPCSSSQVRCAASSVCIARTSWCDGKTFDCPDGSDELYCGNVNGTGKSCSPLSAPKNGAVVGTGTAPGTGLFFSCNTPYVLQGSVIRYCDVSGAWSGVAARCTIPDIPCAYHEFKCSGNGGCISDLKVCDGVWFDCPDGSDERNCTTTRATAAPGQDCLRQQAPPNGYIQGANATNYGDTIAFGCYLPYVIQGSATRTCQASGKWDGAPPVCTLAASCPVGQQPCRDGTCLDSSKFCNGVFFECPDNTDEYQCGATGPGVCPALSAPTNGYAQGKNYTAGGTVIFGCYSGYVLQGSIARICQISGKWNGVVASCSPIQFQCKPGYVSCLKSSGCILASKRCDGIWWDCADGSDELYCPGKVTPAPGQSDCPALTLPAYATMTVTGNSFGNTTSFVCNKPYNLVGSAIRVCEINGQWSGVQPTCSITASVCRYNQWRCNSGQCIAASARCDGNHFDCRDGSDESFCPPQTASTVGPSVITNPGSQNPTTTPAPPATTASMAPVTTTGETQLATTSDVTPCPESVNPCLNNGKCYVIGGAPVCFCEDGFHGTKCQVLDLGSDTACTVSSALPCQNGASCRVSTAAGISYCKCLDGYGGIHCQDNLNAVEGGKTDAQDTTSTNNTPLIVGVAILASLVVIVVVLAIVYLARSRRPAHHPAQPAMGASGFERFNDDLPLTSGMDTPTGSLRGIAGLGGGKQSHPRPGVSNPLYADTSAINY